MDHGMSGMISHLEEIDMYRIQAQRLTAEVRDMRQQLLAFLGSPSSSLQYLPSAPILASLPPQRTRKAADRIREHEVKPQDPPMTAVASYCSPTDVRPDIYNSGIPGIRCPSPIPQANDGEQRTRTMGGLRYVDFGAKPRFPVSGARPILTLSVNGPCTERGSEYEIGRQNVPDARNCMSPVQQTQVLELPPPFEVSQAVLDSSQCNNESDGPSRKKDSNRAERSGKVLGTQLSRRSDKHFMLDRTARTIGSSQGQGPATRVRIVPNLAETMEDRHGKHREAIDELIWEQNRTIEQLRKELCEVKDQTKPPSAQVKLISPSDLASPITACAESATRTMSIKAWMHKYLIVLLDKLLLKMLVKVIWHVAKKAVE